MFAQKLLGMSMGISASRPDTRIISPGGANRHSVVLVEHFGKYSWTGWQPKWLYRRVLSVVDKWRALCILIYNWAEVNGNHGEPPVPSCLPVFKRRWHPNPLILGYFPCWQNSRRNGLCPYNPHVGLYAEDKGFLTEVEGVGPESTTLMDRKLWCHSQRMSLKKNE